MKGYLSVLLHGHLPFVRHPEHERFLEETWLFEAIAECYLPLIEKIEGWIADEMTTPFALTLSPTLCSMLQDPLLQSRFDQYLDASIELAEKETYRTYWEKPLYPLARYYHERFQRLRSTWQRWERNILRAFAQFQDAGKLEILTCAATHAVLPLLEGHLPSLRAQILVARDHYRSCFERDPRGIWLPECAYTPAVDAILQEANIRWFAVETHGLLYARPHPRYGTFAPVYTPNGLAVFGRDYESAKQVWSRDEGYPGDSAYRDFYRDIGFDLDLDYLRPYFAAPPHRSFTGIKYHAISRKGEDKQVYNRGAALEQAALHAQHFLERRVEQIERAATVIDRPPHLLAPYDAELFGHWWYEGPEFLDFFMRKAFFDQQTVQLITPFEYLSQFQTHQVAQPAASSWGEEGYYKVWLNEKNEWIYSHLHVNQERMTELAQTNPHASGLRERALKQAARELLLAQASDWPFILRTGTSPDYATRRVKDHLLRFIALHEQLASTTIDEAWLTNLEMIDNIFPDVNYHYWA